MAERFCKTCRGWHDLDKPWPCPLPAQTKRSDIPSPIIIQDGMDPVQSQLDGQFYDSKSQLRATYKQAGVVEVGNDSSITAPKPAPKKRPNKREIHDTVSKAFSQAGLGA